MTDSNQHKKPLPEQRQLVDALTRLLGQNRLPRGQGGRMGQALLSRLRQGEVQMDQKTLQQLTRLLESLGWKLDDLKAQRDRARRRGPHMR